jgi:hypothetical protein
MNSGLSGLLQNTTFLQVAFVAALVLLISSHKINIEGVIG